MSTPTKRVGIIAGAAVPHAPQLLSLPKSEDAEQVARVKATMHRIGEGLRALQPDLVIVISNDHGDNFALRSVPSFMVHCGARAAGRDGHQGWWAVDGEAGYALVEALQQEGFDPAFTLDAPLGTFFTIPVDYFGYTRETPILPLFVNAYVPPQPLPERCFAFGQALDRALARMGRRAVMIASGGLSHYPGTARYAEPGPDLETDRRIFEHGAAGNLRYLLSLDAHALDRSGNIEARSWLMLAGALGDRRPDIAEFEPNWHHTYAMLGWTTEHVSQREPLCYGRTPSSRVELSRALHELRTDATACEQFLSDAQAFAARYELTAEERAALIELDDARLRDGLSIHPLLSSGAARHVGIVRKRRGS